MTIDLAAVILLVAVAGCIMVRGIRSPGGLYEYPFVAAAVCVCFIGLESIGLLLDKDMQGLMFRVGLMGSLCLFMCYLGWFAGGRIRLKPAGGSEPRRLITAGVALVLLGAFFFYKIEQIPREEIPLAWSGLSVAYRFFAFSFVYGFALSLIMFLRTRSCWALAGTVLAGFFYVERILAGRRGSTIDFALIVLCSFWFCGRKMPPRWLLGMIAVGGIVWIFSIGSYRSVMRSESPDKIEQLLRIDYTEEFTHLITEGGVEVKNAAFLMAAIEDSRAYDFGAYNWNGLIFNFVPAQIVGTRLKNSLMLGVPDVAAAAYQEFGFTIPYGSTRTGLVDCFGSFWYAGCIKFFIIGCVMRLFWRKACAGSAAAGVAYACMMINALHAITHGTEWVFSGLLHMALFLYPCLWYSRNILPIRRVRLMKVGASQYESHSPLA